MEPDASAHFFSVHDEECQAVYEGMLIVPTVLDQHLHRLMLANHRS